MLALPKTSLGAGFHRRRTVFVALHTGLVAAHARIESDVAIPAQSKKG
jgi:hypothetical protein